jgi:hypothetical protein
MFLLSRRFARRLGPVGVALTLYDVWKRLPEKQRRRLIAESQKHGSQALEFVKQHSANIQSRRT